ncbi:hypothetical protein PSCT_02057 [Pseudomonas sp. SCT]|jgi:hypothetical protein|nr:hypothetical protein PSCT_02057 [Pseudomonas sp. SCT]
MRGALLPQTKNAGANPFAPAFAVPWRLISSCPDVHAAARIRDRQVIAPVIERPDMGLTCRKEIAD